MRQDTPKPNQPKQTKQQKKRSARKCGSCHAFAVILRPLPDTNSHAEFRMRFGPGAMHAPQIRPSIRRIPAAAGPFARARCAPGAWRRAPCGAAAAAMATWQGAAAAPLRWGGSPPPAQHPVGHCAAAAPAVPGRSALLPPPCRRLRPHRSRAAECAGLSQAGTPRSAPSDGHRQPPPLARPAKAAMVYTAPRRTDDGGRSSYGHIFNH